MKILQIGITSMLVSLALFVSACGGDEDERAHNIPEANTEAPLLPDTDQQGRHGGNPDFYQIDFPEDYPHIIASLQYSLSELPAGVLSLELAREDVNSPDFGTVLADCFSYDESTQSVSLRHSFPDTAGGRHYLAIFYAGMGIEGTVSNVDYTLSWTPMTTPEGGFELGCVP